jgi:nicotinamide riboside kinase
MMVKRRFDILLVVDIEATCWEGVKRMLSDNYETTITDKFMQQMLARSKDYSIVILKAGPHWNDEGARKIAWEHGRRNFALRADGLLPIVCRVTDDSDVAGVGIFNAGVEETKKIMDQDPGVKAGVFIYEIHPCSSFPGDSLPE